MSKAVFWFRRDLRLDDNTGLLRAMAENKEVVPIFIFDELIIDELPEDDPRIGFIFDRLHKIDKALKAHGSGVLILKGEPVKVIIELLNDESISGVYVNRDYEPYATKRDNSIAELLKQKSISSPNMEVKLNPDFL